MRNYFGFSLQQDPSSEKNSNLFQMILVIGSGILSSTVLATALKAWFDNRKTRLTIQIEGDTKKLEYEGHHLNHDAPTIEGVLDKLSEQPASAQTVDAVTIELIYDATKKEQDREPAHLDASLPANAIERPSFLQRLLPAWPRKKDSAS